MFGMLAFNFSLRKNDDHIAGIFKKLPGIPDALYDAATAGIDAESACLPQKAMLAKLLFEHHHVQLFIEAPVRSKIHPESIPPARMIADDKQRHIPGDIR